MTQWGFYIDTASCTGCKACELACKDKHSFDIGPRARRVREVCSGSWSIDPDTLASQPEDVLSYAVSFSCGHCDDPACVAVCPTGAHHKDAETGLVLINEDRCIGCGSCAINCPYGAPQLDKSVGVMKKCDMCRDLLEHGEDPACVAICPQRALEVGPIDDLRAEHGDVSDIPPLPSSEETHPNVVISVHPDAQSSTSLRPISLGQ